MKITLVVLAVMMAAACGKRPGTAVVNGKSIRIEFGRAMHSRVTARVQSRDVALGAFTPSEFIEVHGSAVKDFKLSDVKQEPTSGAFGAGQLWTLRGDAPGIAKTVQVAIYDEFPRMAFFNVEYTNT